MEHPTSGAYSHKRAQMGLTLLELMLAVLVLSIGLLGFIQGQLRSLQASEYAYWVQVADLTSNELAERFRSCDHRLACQQAQRALWEVEVERMFPQGESRLTQAGPDYQSEILWSLARSREGGRLPHLFRLLFSP